jgi:hypothetical protein
MIVSNNTRVLLFSFLVGFSANLSAHEGHSNTQAVQACHDKVVSTKCSYALGDKLYKGSCRSIASKTMCVRSEPIKFLPMDTELLLRSEDREKKL